MKQIQFAALIAAAIVTNASLAYGADNLDEQIAVLEKENTALTKTLRLENLKKENDALRKRLNIKMQSEPRPQTVRALLPNDDIGSATSALAYAPPASSQHIDRALANARALTAPTAQSATAWTWTGAYVGGNFGYGFGPSRTDHVYGATRPGAAMTNYLDDSSAVNFSGAFGGAQIGYNWQSSNWVYGLEADFQWSDLKGNSKNFDFTYNSVCICSETHTEITQRLKWFGTLRGRIGTTIISPTVLAYVTGGLAYANVTTILTTTGSNVAGPPPVASSTNTSSSTMAGWTIGAGVEKLIAGNWTAKIEYLYMDFAPFAPDPFRVTAVISSPSFPHNVISNSHVRENILRAGANYKF